VQTGPNKRRSEEDKFVNDYMRNRSQRVSGHPGRSAHAVRALLFALPMLLLVASSASAGRLRVEPPVDPNASTIPTNVPATPEPGAALAFAVGIGVVAWAARRTRRQDR
jgi:hypothetical protein